MSPTPVDVMRHLRLFPLVVAGLVLASTATAHAGSLHVYSCRTPAGATAPTEGWSSTLATPAVTLRNSCTSGGELHVDFATAVPVGTVAGWKYTAPDDLRVGRVKLWRSGAATGKTQSGGIPYWLISRPGSAFPADAAEVCGQDPATGNCVYRGDGFNALSDQNVMTFEGLGSSTFWATVQCGGSNQCDGGAPLPSAFLNVHAADVELLDSHSPTISGPTSGDLLADGPVSGKRSVQTSVADIGSGVHGLVAEADGSRLRADRSCLAVRRRAPHPTARGRTPSVSRARCEPPPRPRSTQRPFADGEHALRVYAEDAAGNRTLAVERTILVYNTPATPIDSQGIADAMNPFAQPGHLANGTGTAHGLKPSIRILSRGRSRTVTRGPRRRIRIVGTLATATGQPIAGARLAVISKISGQQAQQLPGYQTTDENGRVSFLLPAGPTRTIRLAYYAFSDSRTFTQSNAVVALAKATISYGQQAVSSAAPLITGKQIKDNSVTGADIRNGTLRANEFKTGDLPRGATGPVAPQGPIGPKGDQGDSGAKGDRGEPLNADSSPAADNATRRSSTSKSAGA